MKCHGFLLVFLLVGSSFSLRSQNDKIVIGPQKLTPYQIKQGAKITYLIRFQNFGADTVKNISVRDTLDPRLDFTTFEMVDASHDYILIRGGEVIRWHFNDIRLPDSTISGYGSRGYIMFKVRPKPTVTSGQVIKNTACIHFDGEKSTCTNEAVIWIDDSGDAPEPVEPDLQITPNPNFGTFEISLETNRSKKINTEILDLTGKRVNFSSSQNEQSQQVTLEHSEPGLYFLKSTVSGRVRVIPFVVTN